MPAINIPDDFLSTLDGQYHPYHEEDGRGKRSEGNVVTELLFAVINRLRAGILLYFTVFFADVRTTTTRWDIGIP